MDAKAPFVSVIVPVFRSEDVLARAIGSVLSQDLKDWEMVLVDDGSPDQSARVIRAYSWIDPRIRTLRQINAGACAARNRGISIARGQYLIFLDADDWLADNALSMLVENCERQGWSAVHAALRYVTPDGRPAEWAGGCPGGVELFDAMCGSNVLSVPSSVLLRRDVIDDIGAFDPSLAHCGDWDLWARLARMDVAVGRLDQCTTFYRMQPGSLSRNPRSLLRDATTVLSRIHRPDGRVRCPRSQWANGADPTLLNERIACFGIYAAGLALGGGSFAAVQAVLDQVQQWPALPPGRCGEFLFYAMCFAHCCGPECADGFWLDVLPVLRQLLEELEDRTGVARFARTAFDAMASCTELPLASPFESDLARSARVPTRPDYFDRTADTPELRALRLLAAGRSTEEWAGPMNGPRLAASHPGQTRRPY